MTIQIARRLGRALNVRSGTRVKEIDESIREYVRSVSPGATIPVLGSIDTSQVVSGTFADARIAQSNVTQHQAALAIAASQVTGTVGATQGGTGQSTYAAGDILYSNAVNTLAKLGIGAAGDLLRVSGGAPAWQAVSTLSLSGSQITSGEVADARLSSNVPLRNAANTFSQTQTLSKEPTNSLTGAALLSAAIPILGFRETGAGADSKVWDLVAFGAQLRGRTATDAGDGNVNWLTVDRTGTTVDLVRLLATVVELVGRVKVTLANYADDTAAAAGGIAVGQLYRNGSVVMVRVT